jgi:hypothetical protein
MQAHVLYFYKETQIGLFYSNRQILFSQLMQALLVHRRRLGRVTQAGCRRVPPPCSRAGWRSCATPCR